MIFLEAINFLENNNDKKEQCIWPENFFLIEDPNLSPPLVRIITETPVPLLPFSGTQISRSPARSPLFTTRGHRVGGSSPGISEKTGIFPRRRLGSPRSGGF